MGLSDKNFLKVCTESIAGLGVSQMYHPAVQELLEGVFTEDLPFIFWVEGQGCTGCTITLLNSLHPSIAEVLLKIISMQYHPFLTASEGGLAIKHMLDKAKAYAGEYIYIIEGSIPIAEDGKYCIIGEIDHHEYTMVEITDIMARNAAVILAVGTCSAYGGVPAAQGQQTGAVSVTQFFKDFNIDKPIINIGGCPPHPDWIIGTLLMLLDIIKRKGTSEGIIEFQKELDSKGRPKLFFPNVHRTCPYLPEFKSKLLSKSITDKDGCRINVGCKGPTSACDSYKRKWNGGVNWCIDNATCIGCTQPDFPDGKSPFYENISNKK